MEAILAIIRKSDGTYTTTTPVSKKEKRRQKDAKRAKTPAPSRGGLMLTREIGDGKVEHYVMDVVSPTNDRPWK